MSARQLAIGFAALVAATPVVAQQRGTVEIGGFGSHTTFAKDLNTNNSVGGGGRVGAFLFPRLSVEFEGASGGASRSLGFPDVTVRVLAARMTLVPITLGPVSFLLGGGGDYTDADFGIGGNASQTWGKHALVGMSLNLTNQVALRLDGVQYLASDWKATNRTLRAGLSFYRNPRGRVTTVTRMVPAPPAPPTPQRPDSVSAAETNRLRMIASSYAALRDSLSQRPAEPVVPPSSAAALAIMHEMVYFANDRSVLSDSAKGILQEKVTVFRANPAMRIVIVGFASQPGTIEYNMALGLKRAEVAKAYLVSQGVDAVRIEIATRGEGQLVVDGPGESADAANRRGQFRLLVADPYLVAPRR